MKLLPVGIEQSALVDDEDYPYLSQLVWYGQKNRNTIYAYTTVSGKMKSLHRMIMNTQKDFRIDHIDHDGLNNQKSNLRLATRSENSFNQKIQTTPKSSRYKGVSWQSLRNKWRVKVKKNSVSHIMGEFHSETQAAFVYDTTAIILFGEFAATNQSLLGEQYLLSEVLKVGIRPSNSYSAGQPDVNNIMAKEKPDHHD